MKKLIKLSILAIVLGCCALLLFTACVPKSLSQAVYENLSDFRSTIFAGKNDALLANYTIGMREEMYEYNGKHTKNVEFGIISVIFTSGMNAQRVPFRLVVGDREFSGNLEKNPFTSEYMADIQEKATDEQIVLEIFADENASITLENQSKNWEINAESALEKGINYLQEELKQFMVNGRFLAETYLKIAYDSHTLIEGYFWNFGVVGQDGKSANVMIDVNNGDLLAKL